jgi:UPF0716 protein FxsA
LGKLFLLFAILPIVEIALLINVGEQIGGWNTVAIVIMTAIAGAYLVRQQGLTTLMQAQQKMQLGALPGQEMAEGLLLVIAGVLLVTPGFVTDTIGFLFCLPVSRPFIATLLLKSLSVRVVNTTTSSHFRDQNQENQPTKDVFEGEVYEGEFERKDEQLKDKLSKPE